MNLPCLHRGLNPVEVRCRVGVDLLYLLRCDDSLGDETIPKHFTRRGMRPDFFVQGRLRERGLVRLVVSVTTVADDIDQKILAEFRPVFDRQPHDVDARLRIVGVHVNDRDLEPLGEITGVPRRPGIDGIRRESDLIVDDDVKRSSRPKTGESREIERLGHNALAGESCVAVHTDGQHRRFVTLPISGEHLSRSGHSPEHWIHDFEMARIRNQYDLDFTAAGDLPLSRRAEVILHVTGLADRVGRGVLSFELLEDRRVRFAERVRQNIDASAVRHGKIDFTGAVRGRRFNRDIEHRNQDVAAFDREALVALIRATEEALESIYFRQPLKYRLLFFLTQWRVQTPAFDLLTEPFALLDSAEV